MKPISRADRDTPEVRAIERRARELTGGKGPIPHKAWRQAIAESAQLIARDPETEGQRVNRIMREVLHRNLLKLRAEARANGWPV